MPTFKALKETHIGKASANGLEGVKLFKEIMAVLGKAKAKNTAQSGNKFWAMREETYYALQASLLSFNAAGALVTGAAQTMPIIGGAVEFLEFIPENAIIGGHGSQYLLVERAGVKLGQSEHAQFIEDNTVYKATSRWDGIPTAGEGFAAFSLSTNPVAGSIQFAEDKANKVEEQG
jgi:HK97 family phage major capsid protein